MVQIIDLIFRGRFGFPKWFIKMEGNPIQWLSLKYEKIFAWEATKGSRNHILSVGPRDRIIESWRYKKRDLISYHLSYEVPKEISIPTIFLDIKLPRAKSSFFLGLRMIEREHYI